MDEAELAWDVEDPPVLGISVVGESLAVSSPWVCGASGKEDTA